MHDEILISASAGRQGMARVSGGALQELCLERRDGPARVGAIYRGYVTRLLPGMEAGFVELAPGVQGLLSLPERAPDGRSLPALRQGQKLLVQVTRDAVGDKQPRLDLDLALPGPHLVLLAGHSRPSLSRRIEDPATRRRLGNLLAELAADFEGASLLARTAAADVTESLLRDEAARLATTWRELQEAGARDAPAQRVWPELPFAQRVLRDYAGPVPRAIRVDDTDTADALRAWCALQRPAFAPLVEHDGGRRSLFARHGVDRAIEALLQPRVPLPSGGSLIIEETAAMTTVDVNTGASSDRSDAALTANLEAAEAIPRQLRLRGIGGLVAVDFISLAEPAAWRQVVALLQRLLAEDGTCRRVHRADPLGVVLFTRKQTGPSLSAVVAAGD
mgnify:FL=1